MLLETVNSTSSTSFDSYLEIRHVEPEPNSLEFSRYHVIRRNGQLVPFDSTRISTAMTKAFLATEGESSIVSHRIKIIVNKLTQQVIEGLGKRLKQRSTVHIEEVQDQVELVLMRAGEHAAARAYILYREEHAKKRAVEQPKTIIHVVDERGNRHPLNENWLNELVAVACTDLADIDPKMIVSESITNLFDGISERDLGQALIMSARTLIEREPNYSLVTARLLLNELRKEAFQLLEIKNNIHEPIPYIHYFKRSIQRGIDYQLLNPQLMSFDLEKLASAIEPSRDLMLNYLGLQTLYDRYLLQWKGVRFELPQTFFMRVAMGLAINETEKENRAIEFYNALSTFNLMCSTPTLFNSGSLHPQLSSCFLSTVPDDLEGIYSAIKDNALMQKWAGGIGNDWTNVRGMGSLIRGTNGKSQGVVPFLKVANDTLVAVNQGGRRRGSGCAYLETWHIDIEEFLELRKNTGDERRRTHDMNTANWIPDLFMERVHENGQWTLFSPDEAPDLHELYGITFKEAYLNYEKLADEGHIQVWKRLSAVELWRKMLTLLFETGHAWITFKDPCNIRSSQQHTGVVHSSNLCTEITLNTKTYHDPAKNKEEGEIGVCNLASINLANHIRHGQLDVAKLQKTVRTAMRMLDNVIDINYYPVPQAHTANVKHRPVGLGLMGFQDALYQLKIPYASHKAVEFADESMELISYYALLESTYLAEERGSYSSFDGSLWSQGILPVDSILLLKQARRQYLDMSTHTRLDWDSVRNRVKSAGMRNSNCMAIAPTATISNICGVSQSIEPTYQNLFVKSNLSGEFTVINPYLVRDLKALRLWDATMVNDLKFHDGSIQKIDRIPDTIKQLYLTAFEVDPVWLVEAASRRQKWIDQSQSLNVYMAEPSGHKLDALYKLAWLRGLKTTYYLRSMGATHVEKSTLHEGKLNAVKMEKAESVCRLDDDTCEVCQ